MSQHKSAPNFVEKLRLLLEVTKKTQGKLAKETGIPIASINRICKNGMGSEENICKVLNLLGLKRRRMLEMLTDRRAEICTGEARETWRDFRYAFLTEEEYLQEICPFPLDNAYACTQHGISLTKVVKLAQQHGITHIKDLKEINPWRLVDFVKAFEEEFGESARADILTQKCKKYPPVLFLEFLKDVDANDYVTLSQCTGRLLFGLSHLILGEYWFEKDGEICRHRNPSGVEFLYSLKGTFELNYQGHQYKTRLESNGSILVFDARHRHSIKLIQGDEQGKGILIMVRYDPQKRKIEPGRPRRPRSSSQAKT